jgi:hypothetical protein
MTWTNLLSGLIGSVVGSTVGVIGAWYLAVRTIRDTQAHEKKTAYRQLQVNAAGELAVEISVVYEILIDVIRSVDTRTVDDPAPIDAEVRDRLRPAADQLRRRIIIDSPLLWPSLAQVMRKVDAAMRAELGRTVDATPKKGGLLELQTILREARDQLSVFRGLPPEEDTRQANES